MHQEWAPGRLAAGEGFLACWPRKPITGPKAPILFCPQAAGAASLWLNPNDATYGGRAGVLRRLSEDLGALCLSSDMGGPNLFGNPAATARVKALYDWAQTQPGVRPGRVLMVATSMGNMTALRFAADYPGLVAGVVSFFGMADPVLTYQQNLGGVAASLAAAWGVVPPAPLPAGASLAALAATGVPWLGYSGTADALVPPATQMALASAIGGTYRTTGPTGHGDDTIAAAPYAEYSEFLRRRL